MEAIKFNFFAFFVDWVKSLFAKKVMNSEIVDEEVIEEVVENNIEVVGKEVLFSFRIYEAISGYHVTKAVFKFGNYETTLDRMGTSEFSSNEITVSSKDVDFDKLNGIKLELIIQGDDGQDTIELNDIVLGFDKAYLNTNKKLYFKLTSSNLGLIPIVFGNPTVEDYHEIKPYF